MGLRCEFYKHLVSSLSGCSQSTPYCSGWVLAAELSVVLMSGVEAGVNYPHLDTGAIIAIGGGAPSGGAVRRHPLADYRWQRRGRRRGRLRLNIGLRRGPRPGVFLTRQIGTSCGGYPGDAGLPGKGPHHGHRHVGSDVVRVRCLVLSYMFG